MVPLSQKGEDLECPSSLNLAIRAPTAQIPAMDDLFGATPAPPSGSAPSPPEDAPLADRLRPRVLDDVVGQEHLTGPDGAIGRMVAAGRLSSIILWGPPGTGKTSIARLLANAVGLRFEPISAVFSGVADLKKLFAGAREHARIGQRTLNHWRFTSRTVP